MTEPPHRSAEVEDLEQVLREMALSSKREHERKQIPPHWVELIKDVGRAAAIKIGVPGHPRHKIGRFEGIGLRGHGGFGLVFEVLDPELDRRVALKICLTRGPKAAQAIINEAKLLAKLSHPNIVTVHEPGRYGDDVFFVMEYVKGLTVHDFAFEDPPPSWEQIVDVYLAAGAGLAAAHDADIVHGDFKPANILLDEAGSWPRVADFGLAQIMIEHASQAKRRRLRNRAGTMCYMAPEVLRGQLGDKLSDQWSFCVSLWQTLDQDLPFEGESSDQLLEAIETSQPWEMNPEVPEAVRAVVRVGLSVDPRERYPDMHTLLRELGKLRQPPIAAPPSPESSPLDKAPSDRSRLGPFVIAMLAAGGSVLGVLGVLGWLGRPRVEYRDLAEALPAVAPASPCAIVVSEVSTELDPVVVAVCTLIRGQRFDEATGLWSREHEARLADNEQRVSAVAEALREDTLTVARTFVDQAESLRYDNPSEAAVAADHALRWTYRTTDLGEDNPDVQDVAKRAQEVILATSATSG